MIEEDFSVVLYSSAMATMKVLYCGREREETVQNRCERGMRPYQGINQSNEKNQ